MNGLIDIALARLAEVEENNLGDAAFVIPMGDGARLMQGDVSIHHATEQPRKLRTADDYAITVDDVTGVDWKSSATGTIANAEGITVPMLVMVMIGHYFIRSGEMTLDAAASADKGTGRSGRRLPRLHPLQGLRGGKRSVRRHHNHPL